MYDCVRKRLVNKFELKNLMYNKRYFIFFTLIIRGSKIQENFRGKKKKWITT